LRVIQGLMSYATANFVGGHMSNLVMSNSIIAERPSLGISQT